MAVEFSRERVALVGAVNETQKVDTSIFKLMVGGVKYFNTETIEYEVKDNKSKTAVYKSFGETAEIVERNGTDVVRVKPYKINRSVTFSEIEAYQRDFGANPYANIQNIQFHATKEALYDYCRAGALKRQKKIVAEVLQNLNLAKQGEFAGADFNIDVATFKTSKSEDKWDEADAPVLEDLRKLRALSKGTVYLMNSNTYSQMLRNGDLFTADNSNGTRRNFDIDTASDINIEAYRVGKVLDPLAMCDVYIWDSKDEDETYLDDGIVVCSKPNILQGMFGGIYTRPKPNADAVVVATEWTVEKVRIDNPTTDALVYKSAPMYAPKGTKAISVLKAY